MTKITSLSKEFRAKPAAPAAAYLVTAIVNVWILYAVNQNVDVNLQFFLAYFLLHVMTSGIEPGNAKSHFSNGGKVEELSHAWVILQTVVTSVFVFPVIYLLAHMLMGPSDNFSQLVWLLPSMIFVGFLTTNYRIVLDCLERHSAAVSLKQLSLILGVVVGVMPGLINVSIEQAIMITLCLRLALLLPFVWSLPLANTGERKPTELVARGGWWQFTSISVVGTLSGSADRLMVASLLPEETGAAYYLIFEIVSKFWFLSYVLGPIIFAQAVRQSNAHFINQSVLAVGVLGLAFVICVAFAVPVLKNYFPDFFEVLGVLTLPLLAFAVSMNGVAQLLASFIQGRGLASALVYRSTAVMILSFPLFYYGTLFYGLSGTVLAWLVKSISELVLFTSIDRSLFQNKQRVGSDLHEAD